MTTTTKIPANADAWVGKTHRIALTLFNKVPRILADPNIDIHDRKWLFAGPPGNGKTSLAIALAHALAGTPFAVEVVNGQSCTVDVVRYWEETITGRPLIGSMFVKVIDEIDAASLPACNELRTYLDRLPPYTVIIATTNKQIKELQEQLQSRFQVWHFDPIPDPLIHEILLCAPYYLDPATARQIAVGASGNVRSAILDAKSHLDARMAA